MYKQQVLRILLDVGQRGMSAALLSRHVYNLNTTFFFQPDIDEIRRKVWAFLQRNAHSRRPLVEHTDRHGYYRLSRRGIIYTRKMLASLSDDIHSDEPAETEKLRQDDLPGLFD